MLQSHPTTDRQAIQPKTHACIQHFKSSIQLYLVSCIGYLHLLHLWLAIAISVLNPILWQCKNLMAYSQLPGRLHLRRSPASEIILFYQLLKLAPSLRKSQIHPCYDSYVCIHAECYWSYNLCSWLHSSIFYTHMHTGVQLQLLSQLKLQNTKSQFPHACMVTCLFAS